MAWTLRMLTAPATGVFGTPAIGPSKRLVAQTALLHLLSTNVDLFGVFVDQSYAAEPFVSRAYFQVSAVTNLHLTAVALILHS